MQRLNSSRSPYVTRRPHTDESTELPLDVVAGHMVRRAAEEEAALLQRLTVVSRASRVTAGAVLAVLVTTALAIVVTAVVAIVVVAASTRLAMIVGIAAVVGLAATVRIVVIALRVAVSAVGERVFYMSKVDGRRYRPRCSTGKQKQCVPTA